MYERDLGFEIFGQKFTLGTERLVFDTAVPTIDETRPDGSFRVVVKPGGSDRFVSSLARTGVPTSNGSHSFPRAERRLRGSCALMRFMTPPTLANSQVIELASECGR